MGALVVDILTARRSPQALESGWRPQERAELLRAATMLQGRLGPIELADGLTDQGEPWAVLIDSETGEVLAHFARIDGRFVASLPQHGIALDDREFRVAIDRTLAKSSGTAAASRAAEAQRSATIIDLFSRGPLAVATLLVTSSLFEAFVREAHATTTGVGAPEPALPTGLMPSQTPSEQSDATEGPFAAGIAEFGGDGCLSLVSGASGTLSPIRSGKSYGQALPAAAVPAAGIVSIPTGFVDAIMAMTALGAERVFLAEQKADKQADAAKEAGAATSDDAMPEEAANVKSVGRDAEGGTPVSGAMKLPPAVLAPSGNHPDNSQGGINAAPPKAAMLPSDAGAPADWLSLDDGLADILNGASGIKPFANPHAQVTASSPIESHARADSGAVVPGPLVAELSPWPSVSYLIEGAAGIGATSALSTDAAFASKTLLTFDGLSLSSQSNSLHPMATISIMPSADAFVFSNAGNSLVSGEVGSQGGLVAITASGQPSAPASEGIVTAAFAERTIDLSEEPYPAVGASPSATSLHQIDEPYYFFRGPAPETGELEAFVDFDQIWLT